MKRKKHIIIIIVQNKKKLNLIMRNFSSFYLNVFVCWIFFYSWQTLAATEIQFDFISFHFIFFFVSRKLEMFARIILCPMRKEWKFCSIPFFWNIRFCLEFRSYDSQCSGRRSRQKIIRAISNTERPIGTSKKKFFFSCSLSKIMTFFFLSIWFRLLLSFHQRLLLVETNAKISYLKKIVSDKYIWLRTLLVIYTHTHTPSI